MTQDSAPEHQQDAGEEEWAWVPIGRDRIGLERPGHDATKFDGRAYTETGEVIWFCSTRVRDEALADHAAARRALKLEGALALSLQALEISHRDIDDGRPCYAREAKRAARALLSPAAGKEEAG